MSIPEEFVLKEIEENLKFVLYNIYPEKVQIHIDHAGKQATDWPRTFYTYFTISRLWKNNLGNLKNQYPLQFWQDRLSRKNNISEPVDKLFVCLYGMRACKNFGFNDILLDFVNDFKNIGIDNVYHSPISMYVFMSAVNEVPELRQDIFLKSIYNNCEKALEVLLNRVNINSHPFYFSEFSYFPEKVPKYLWAEVQKYIKDNFNKSYLSGNLASSGVAKTLEHFANVGDVSGFNLGLEFLEKRKYKNLRGFKNTFLPEVDRIYLENNNSMYVVLDTNTHLLNAYINFYTKSISVPL